MPTDQSLIHKIDPVTNIFYNDDLKDTFKNISLPIDMVYTWVDSTDPKWIDLKQILCSLPPKIMISLPFRLAV